jgi:hypothetical protein
MKLENSPTRDPEPHATDGGDIAKNVKRTLGLDDNGTSKEQDDEMKRPPEDRSPLT